MSSSFKWKMGTPIYTYVSDIYIKNKEKQNVYVYMWSRLGVVASSERIILIALAGKHIWLFLWWKNGCVVENNKRVERKWWQRVCSFIYEETTTTTIINSFTVCLLCLSENHHHHYNHYSTLIIFKRKPTAMQILMSLNTC